MEMNNITAPEYYSNDPNNGTSQCRNELIFYLARVEDSLLNSPVDELCNLYPDMRVMQSGDIIILDEQPPLIYLHQTGDGLKLIGCYNDEVEEIVTRLKMSFVEELKGELPTP